AEPLRLSWIWNVVANPVQRADGTLDKSVVDDMRLGGRLDRIWRLLASAGRFPLTVGLGPETLQSWIDLSRKQSTLRRGAARVRSAVRRESIPLLPEPYVPIDGPTIEAEDLGQEVPGEYVAGSNAIDAATGEIPDPRTAFEEHGDAATLRRLTQLLVGRFVVRDTALAPVDQPRTPAQPFALTAGTEALPAPATDSGLEQLFTTAGPPALRVQRVLAGLAEIAYEAPSQ